MKLVVGHVHPSEECEFSYGRWYGSIQAEGAQVQGDDLLRMQVATTGDTWPLTETDGMESVHEATNLFVSFDIILLKETSACW